MSDESCPNTPLKLGSVESELKCPIARVPTPNKRPRAFTKLNYNPPDPHLSRKVYIYDYFGWKTLEKWLHEHGGMYAYGYIFKDLGIKSWYHLGCLGVDEWRDISEQIPRKRRAHETDLRLGWRLGPGHMDYLDKMHAAALRDVQFARTLQFSNGRARSRTRSPVPQRICAD